jgi:outer membrane protein assembly factor BamA
MHVTCRRVLVVLSAVFFLCAGVCATAQTNPAAANSPAAPTLVQHVSFVGAEHVPAADLNKFAKDLEGTARLTDLRQKVADFWHSYGFYRVQVEAEPHMSANKWGEAIGEVTFRITEGARYRLEDVSWSGATALTPAELNTIFPVKSGDVFDTSEVRRGMGLVRAAYAQRGYREVVAFPAMRVNDVDHLIALHFDVREGRRENTAPSN